MLKTFLKNNKTLVIHSLIFASSRRSVILSDDCEIHVHIVRVLMQRLAFKSSNVNPPPPKKKKTYSLPHCIWQAWRVFSFDQHRSFYKISKILDFSKKGSYVRAELLVTWRRCFNSLNFRQCYCALAIKMYALFWSERIFYQNCPFYDRFRC